MSTEERIKVLNMIAEGQVTADEGAQLLSAMEMGVAPAVEPAPEPAATIEPVAKPKPAASPIKIKNGNTRYLRIKVVEASGTKVNVNLPLSLMEVGLKLGGKFVDELNDMDAELQMLMEAVQNDVSGKIVEVDDEDSHVEIYIE